MATSRNCLLWHRTLNCHLIHLCGETGMGDFHSRSISVLKLSLWLLRCLPQNPFQDDWIHLGSFRCSSGTSSCPVSQVQWLRGHLGSSSWASRVAAWGLWMLGMVAGWWFPRLPLPAALSSVCSTIGMWIQCWFPSHSLWEQFPLQIQPLKNSRAWQERGLATTLPFPSSVSKSPGLVTLERSKDLPQGRASSAKALSLLLLATSPVTAGKLMQEWLVLK